MLTYLKHRPIGICDNLPLLSGNIDNKSEQHLSKKMHLRKNQALRDRCPRYDQ